MDLKKPRGRPAMDCNKINEKTFGRKKDESQKRAQLAKCATRNDHPVKPCVVNNNKCVSKTMKPTCANLSFDTKKKFNTVKERKTAFSIACKQRGEELNKKCVPKKSSKLICHDATKVAKKV